MLPRPVLLALAPRVIEKKGGKGGGARVVGKLSSPKVQIMLSRLILTRRTDTGGGGEGQEELLILAQGHILPVGVTWTSAL